MGLFEDYRGPADLPLGATARRKRVAYAVRRLDELENQPQAMRVLRDVGPFDSSNYLTRAIDAPLAGPSAVQLLLEYGPSRWTVNPLVEALVDKNRAADIVDILSAYGPSTITLEPLTKAAEDATRHEPIQQVFLSYGLTRGTEYYLKQMQKSSNPAINDFGTRTLDLLLEQA